MKFAIILAAILLASVTAPTAVFAHYPHYTPGECSSTEQLGSREKCLIEQRESAKEVKFMDMFFSEGSNNVGGNLANTIPAKIEIQPGDGTTRLVAVMANSGAFELTGLKGWLSLPVGFEAAGRPAGEPAFDSYDLGIAPGAVFVFEFPVVVTKDTRVGMYNAVLHVEYFKARDIGLNYRDFDVEFLLPGKAVINAVIDEPIIPTITSTPLTVSIYNNGTAMMGSVEVTLSTPITATVALNQQVPEASKSPIMILGGDGYTKVDAIKPGAKVDVKVTLFASEEAVNTAFQLPVNISYFDVNGEPKKIQRFVSVYVQGTISLRVYDIGITYIANEPNLSGYLLNEGTNLAMFTTVELMGNQTSGSLPGEHGGYKKTEFSENQVAAEAAQDAIRAAAGPQYLGDLTANSPLPFNIPIRFAEGTGAGSYPAKIMVSYKDDLRKSFEKEIDTRVSYTPPVVEKHESVSIYSNMGIGILAGIGAAGGLGYYFVRRKMKMPAWTKESKGKIDSEDNTDFLSDSKQ